MSIDQLLEKYDYAFPKSAIATSPAIPHDNAKLLIHDRSSGDTFFDYFYNLPNHLPTKSVLVFNETKVINAKLALQKPNGTKIEIIYIKNQDTLFEAKSNKKIKPKDILFYNDYVFEVIQKSADGWLLKPDRRIISMESFLQTHGTTPLPPYIKDSPLSEEEKSKYYQTTFAKNIGSIASPTASLHFTPTLLDNLRSNNIKTEFITLHVGLGTFATLKEENVKEKKLHQEQYIIDTSTAQRLNDYKNNGYKIIAVGTTVVRTLESSCADGEIKNLAGQTNLFIQEGYDFKFVDQIITNFHVPKSSLLMLVSAFAGREKILDLYKEAMSKNFKLFSFGDGMYIK